MIRMSRSEGLEGEEALDVVSDAFVAFLSRTNRPPLDAARPMLLAYTRNLARNRRRSHAYARPHDAEETGTLLAPTDPPDAALEQQEVWQRFGTCVANLQQAQRSVITLRIFNDRSSADVAAELGLDPGHVAVLLHRAKASLTHCMLESP